jgi:hypothetical protein
VLGRITEPKPHLNEPRALFWLALQRRRVSVIRVRSTQRPLEPYIQAANVLRASGRINAANRVELARMRLRRNFLSWRSHFVPRIVLLVTDKLTKYSFNTVRAAFWTVVLIAVGGMAFHQADRCNLVWPIDAPLAAQTAKVTDKNVWWQKRTPNVSSENVPRPLAAHMPSPYPNFVSVLYAMDVVIPILDFGQQSRWDVFSSPARDTLEARRSGKSHPPHACFAPELTGQFLESLTWILQILGWVLTTAIAIALITRIETIIARNEE